MEGEFFARRGRVLVPLSGLGFVSFSPGPFASPITCRLARTPLYRRIAPLAEREQTAAPDEPDASSSIKTVRLEYAGYGRFAYSVTLEKEGRAR